MITEKLPAYTDWNKSDLLENKIEFSVKFKSFFKAKWRMLNLHIRFFSLGKETETKYGYSIIIIYGLSFVYNRFTIN